MSMINPVGNQVSQPFLSQDQTAQQNVSQNVRVGQEASANYAPNSAEWVRNNPVAQTKEKEKARAKLAQAKEECQTCAGRRYQDGSNDMGVSFKTPQHISPEQSASAVAAHESEHVSRNRAQAEINNKEVVYQRVALQTDICPECGKVYVSGGTTTTVTRDNPQKEQYDFAVAGNLLDTRA